MSRLLSGTQSALTRAWAIAIRHVRDSNPVAEVADRIRHHFGPEHMLVGLDTAIASFATAEHNAYNAAAQAESRFASTAHDRVSKKLLNFDPADPDVMTWAERNRLDLVTGLTFEQRSLIRAMLIRIEEEGINPLTGARDILDSIGLTPYQEQLVESYRDLLTAGQYSQALQRELSSGTIDRSIRAARDADRSLTGEQIERAVAAYRQNAIRMRAETIARTESQRIAHQGSDGLYSQALRRGDLQAEQIECAWLATKDPRTRDTHREMDGQTRDWGEPFDSPSGAQLRFPGDPEAPAKETVNCRCTRTVRIKAVAEAGRRAA